jgi:hypothetical protein
MFKINIKKVGSPKAITAGRLGHVGAEFRNLQGLGLSCPSADTFSVACLQRTAGGGGGV